MTYPVANIDGIGPGRPKAQAHRIRTTTGLLEAAKSLKGRKQLAEKDRNREKRLLKWANSADRMRIKGVGDDYAELIRAAGVDTVRELKYRNATRLTAGRWPRPTRSASWCNSCRREGRTPLDRIRQETAAQSAIDQSPDPFRLTVAAPCAKPAA